MPVRNGLMFNDAGALAVTDAASTIAQSFQRNGRAVAADLSLYTAAAADEGEVEATDFVKQGFLMRADGVLYATDTLPDGAFFNPSGIRKRSDNVLYNTTSPSGKLRTTFDPLVGQVFIDENGGVYIQ